MKKHILGLALFSFIVSAAAIVYAVLNFNEIIPVSEINSTPQYIPSERTRCKMKRQSKTNSIEITQAVYNARTKHSNLELAVSRDVRAIALHFFSKNNNDSQYIKTVQLEGGGDYRNVSIDFEAFDWLNKRASRGNFFVIAESTNEYLYIDSENQPKFDSQKAVAITVGHDN